MEIPNEAQLRELARKRVAFRAHLIVYCITIAALWGIWYATGSHYPWPIWPMAGWGIGLIFHYLFDYRPSGMLSEDEEFKKLKKEWEEHHPMAS